MCNQFSIENRALLHKVLPVSALVNFTSTRRGAANRPHGILQYNTDARCKIFLGFPPEFAWNFRGCPFDSAPTRRGPVTGNFWQVFEIGKNNEYSRKLNSLKYLNFETHNICLTQFSAKKQLNNFPSNSAPAESQGQPPTELFYKFYGGNKLRFWYFEVACNIK